MIQDMRENMVERHVKGGVLHARMDWVREKHGLDGLEALMMEAQKRGYSSPLAREEFKIAKWYPFNDLMILMRSYIDKYGIEKFYQMSRESAKKTGVAGFLIKWASSPETLLKKAAEYWPNFYDFGKIEGGAYSSNHGYLKGDGELSTEPIFCESLTHYLTGILENLRIKDITVGHIKCIHKGDEHCEWDVLWR